MRKPVNVPVDAYIERLLLGAILVSCGESMDTMRSTMDPDDFGIDKHRRLWNAMCELYDSTGSLDRVVLCRELQRRGELEACGGLTYLAFLEEGMPILPCLDQYIDALKDKALQRRLLLLVDNIAQRAEAELESGAELRESLESAVGNLMSVADRTRGPRQPMDIVGRLGVDEVLLPTLANGVRLPWWRLDDALHGFRDGQSIVVAADTGKGKTSLACQIATHVTKQGKSVLYWSLEMPARSLLRRMAYQMSGTDSRDLNPTADARAKQRDALTWLCEHPVWFDDRSTNVGAFCSSLRYVNNKSKLGLVVVDYLGLIRGTGYVESRTREVGDNSRALKLAALKFNLPFLVLSQYRRPAKGEQPSIHSLKESGDVENDADVVLLMNSSEFVPDANTVVDIHVGKQREGPSGYDIPLVFRPASQSFQTPDDGRGECQ